MGDEPANVHFMSQKHDWETPQDFFDRLDAEFRFTLDPCCTPETAKCPTYFTPVEDGLSQDWAGHTVYMNPPYGREIVKWMKKAYESCVVGGATVVCLVPARTDTNWWHTYAVNGEIRFIRGRLKFGGCKNSAPFPSAVVVFRPQEDKTCP